MGRLAGFLCGTTLVLLPLHLTLTRIRSDVAQNRGTLQSARLIAESTLHPRVPLEPIKARIARPSLVETMKDTWNLEVERGVRWVQGWDMVKAREGVEGVVGGVWTRWRRGGGW